MKKKEKIRYIGFFAKAIAIYIKKKAIIIKIMTKKINLFLLNQIHVLDKFIEKYKYIKLIKLYILLILRSKNTCLSNKQNNNMALLFCN